MAFDFPASPTVGQVYNVGSAAWVWNGYAWTGGLGGGAGGGGGGLPDAPVDGKQYAREDANWSEVVIPPGDWASISGKPATFPPSVHTHDWATGITGKPATFPSDWNTTVNKPASFTPSAHTHDFTSGITGKPGTYPPTLPIPWTDISSKPATFPPDLPIGWTSISGKPATFPPTVPIAVADVSGLQGQLDTLTLQLDGKVDVAGETMTGDLYIYKTSPSFGLDKAAAGQQATLFGYSAHSTRWAMSLGDATAEGGSNAGSNFYLARYSDGGAQIDKPITINRATGVIDFAKAPTVAGAAIVAAVTISDAAPSSPIDGQLWWRSTDGVMFIRFNDGTSTQWVEA